MTDAHPRTEGLLRLARNESPAVEARALRAHVASCAICARRLDGFRGVLADPETAIQRFEETLDPTLTRAASPEADADDGGFLRVAALLDAARAVASATLDGAGGLLSARLRVDYAGVAGVEGSAEPSLRAASESLGRGDEAETRRYLAVAGSIDPRAAATADLELVHEGRPWGRLLVEAERGSVTVIVRPGLPSRPGRLRVSTPDGKDRVATFAAVEGADYVRAEVSGLTSGTVQIAIESLTP